MSDISKPAAALGNLPLERRQVGLSLLVGAVLWFVAAMMLLILGPMGIYEGSSRVILYALIIPGTVPFLLIGFRIARLEIHQYFIGTALMDLAAMLLDGVALAWFPALYGGTPELVAGAGAAILWGAGVALALAFFMNRTGR